MAMGKMSEGCVLKAIYKGNLKSQNDAHETVDRDDIIVRMLLEIDSTSQSAQLYTDLSYNSPSPSICIYLRPESIVP
jgi:hypothetical protein